MKQLSGVWPSSGWQPTAQIWETFLPLTVKRTQSFLWVSERSSEKVGLNHPCFQEEKKLSSQPPSFVDMSSAASSSPGHLSVFFSSFALEQRANLTPANVSPSCLSEILDSGRSSSASAVNQHSLPASHRASRTSRPDYRQDTTTRSEAGEVTLHRRRL